MITQELAIMFGIIAIIFAAVICILLKKGVKKTALVCIFIAYITAVVCIVFFPIPYASDPIEYLNGYTWYNFVPFAMITEALSNGFGETAFLQIFGNIFLSVPFGFFVMMWMKSLSFGRCLFLHLLLLLRLKLHKCSSVLQSTVCTAMLTLTI